MIRNVERYDRQKMTSKYLVAVDVGTASVRAALITTNGQIKNKTTQPIKIWNPEREHYEQSSEDIWNAVCYCVKHVCQNVKKSEIISLSFDATCSLVILDKNGEPLTISKTHNHQQNVILWMDHRARLEADEINAGKYDILKYVGGQISVEMQLPKMKWLKTNLYEITWQNIWRAMDLADFLTWRSTDYDTRSLCTVTCKWNYDAILKQWDHNYFHAIGLNDLLENNAAIIGQNIVDVGKAIGKGLTEKAANELNLLPGIIVSSALIDAHAGALGMFGCRHLDQKSNERMSSRSNDICGKLALICGSSTCHMSLTTKPEWLTGIWGPYRSAIIPDFYLNEGGQSVTGLLLDHIIKSHPQYEQITKNLSCNQNIYTYLNEKLKQITEEHNIDNCCYLTKDLHIWPDFHGNRSPLTDPNLKGMINGVTMNTAEESLAILYLAVMQSLAYSTRHIIETLLAKGRMPFHMLAFCGGLAQNELYVQCHADIIQLPCLLPNEQQDMVLIGTAMLGASAAGFYTNLQAATFEMGGYGRLIKPATHVQQYHKCKYKVFLEMLKDQRKYQKIMNGL